MAALLNFDKTNMIQPDSGLFENYRSSKQELNRIHEKKKIKNERLEILSESNDRLNTEVQRLKKSLSAMNNESHTTNTDKQLFAKVQILENQYKSEKKKNILLTIKFEKLEALLDEVYAEEKDNTLERSDIDNIKLINNQLSSLLQKLKK